MKEPGFLRRPPNNSYYTTGRKHQWQPKDSTAKRWTCRRCGCIRQALDFDTTEPYIWYTAEEPGYHLHQEPECLTRKTPNCS